jgi:hypothetical protein
MDLRALARGDARYRAFRLGREDAERAQERELKRLLRAGADMEGARGQRIDGQGLDHSAFRPIACPDVETRLGEAHTARHQHGHRKTQREDHSIHGAHSQSSLLAEHTYSLGHSQTLIAGGTPRPGTLEPQAQLRSTGESY